LRLWTTLARRLYQNLPSPSPCNRPSRLAALFAEKLASPLESQKIHSGLPPPRRMFQISRDTPAYYITCVTHQRLPIFRTPELATVAAQAFDEARNSAGLLIFAYVIMLDHYHMLTDNARAMKDVLRFMNGISARRIIDHLKTEEHSKSLAKLRIADQKDGQKFSVYEHAPNALRITGEDAFMQKVNNIHLNPVRAGLVDHPDDHLFSSARQWHRKTLENEPLLTDHLQIKWR
jgi:putative transposase